MYLKTIKIWNFRCIGANADGKPGLEINFHPKLNVLIGPNDSGKTAIVDAIRYCLGTQTYDTIRIEDEDFYEKDGIRFTEFRIECIFSGFTVEEAGQFLEWIDTKDSDDILSAELRISLSALRKNNRIVRNIKAGIDDEGQYFYGEARDLLRVTYLKPLRDAETELSPGYRSRLAQILKAHPVFIKDSNKHPFVKYFEISNRKIKEFFEKERLEEDKEYGIESNTKGGKEIKEKFNSQTKEFLEIKDDRAPNIDITKPELNSILRKLELYLEKNKSGLGTLNQLYMAAELIHLNRENHIGLRLGLIEELEAHLHPQAQLRVLKSLISDKNKNVQYILTTHSTLLGASVPLKYLILCSEGNVYPLDKESTKLNESDYKFLERFLDATKANLFFAKGVILVEGDAENIIIPTLAELIGKPLHKYGVSIVNVGNTAFLRYVNIFKRRDDDSTLPIKVAIVTDLDLKVDENGRPEISEEEINEKRKKIEDKYNSNDGNIKVFISPFKTLEFDIALGNLYWYVHKAIRIAMKIKNSNERNDYWISDEEVKKILKSQDSQNEKDEILKETDIYKRAYQIYEPLRKSQASKTVTAQWFAQLIRNNHVRKKLIKRDTKIKYLIDSILFVTK